MAITHTSRTGKTYYLHTGPKRGGGTQHFLSTKRDGPMAACIPEGFEIYETVNGMVYLRRQQPRLVRDEELECVRAPLAQPRGGRHYRVEAQGRVITIHESCGDFSFLRSWAPHVSAAEHERIQARSMHYQPVMRFTLVDEQKREFAPERYCFRGCVDDWIPIGPPGSLKQLAARLLKHLGKDTLYDLYGGGGGGDESPACGAERG
jgi:hypothetical protein